MNQEEIKQISLLEDRLRKLTTDFSQSREFVRLSDGYNGDYVSLDIKDFLIIGAITNSGILFTGKSGGGKTHLAKMAMNAVYGSGNYANRTITPGMNEEAFLDIDFGKIKDGSTLKEAMSETPILTKPGVILNEVNRAPALIQNILIPYLEFEFNIKGLDFPVGLALPTGKGRYQFRILTINEGTEYKGIATMDKAVRDRMVIEVPIDQFKSLKQDIRDMVKHRKSSAIAVEETKESLTDMVMRLHQRLVEIPLGGLSAEFLVYISGMSNCIKSPTGSKEGIEFKLDLCKGCHHAAFCNNICGNVYAPTNRSLINLETVAKGIAAVRAYKALIKSTQREKTDSKRARAISDFMKSEFLVNLEVTPEDILACAPFVLYSKIQINDQWVQKHFQGSRFLAVQTVIQTACAKFLTFYKDHQDDLVTYASSGNGTGMIEFLKKYAKEKDAWMANIQDFENRIELYDTSVGNLVASYGG